MRSCTFFGHRNFNINAVPLILNTIRVLIENEDVDVFFIGNNGAFDASVISTLDKLRSSYNFKAYIVLPSYSPFSKCSATDLPFNTIIPDGLERIPKKFAILKRNEWMINHSDFIVTYVRHEAGSGAAKAKKLAIAKNKTVIELYSQN